MIAAKQGARGVVLSSRRWVPAVLLALLASSAVQAGTVTLVWVPLSGTGSAGTLTLSSSQIVNPSNFTITDASLAAASADISSFTFTIGGTTFNSASPYTLLAAGTPAQVLAGQSGWAVTPNGTGGKLTSAFALVEAMGSNTYYGLFGGIPLLTSPANALSGLATYNATTGAYSASASAVAGYWAVQPVPLPGALVLLGSGLFGLFAFGRRSAA